jgi:tRNA dimethylallyltransferase
VAPVLFVLGPTASGKTALACALAEHLPVDLISVDSAQVYRYMNVGTAKPDAATLARYPHQLIDVIDPDAAYSAADFCRDANAAIAASHAARRIPLLVGGTMMYVKALIDGLSALPSANPSIRAAIEAKAAESGWPALHLALQSIDPITAARLAPNDSQRIGRALEVYEATGQPISALQTRVTGNAASFNHHAIGVALMPSERSALHARIASRFDDMLAAGLVDELAALRTRFALDATKPSMRTVGYRQAWQFLEGEIDRSALRESGIAATRQLAKRQMTWLRAMPQWTVLDCLAPRLSDTALTHLNAGLVQGR